MSVRRIAGRRIVILCEGDTEEIVVRHFVRRQWKLEGLDAVGLHTDNLQGSLTRIGTKATLYLEEKEVLGVFILIDLYGLTTVKHDAFDDVGRKVLRVQEWLRSTVKSVRLDEFHPCISVHEVEALILAEGGALSKRLSAPQIGPDPNAETRNFLNSPSSRLDDLFRVHKKRGYQKIMDGTPLFQHMHFDPVYRSCSYFRGFFEKLKDVARSAIDNSS